MPLVILPETSAELQSREKLRLAVATAMRLDEICQLQLQDVDLDGRIAVVRDRKDPRHKVGNHQEVPLLDANGYDPVQLIREQLRPGRLPTPAWKLLNIWLAMPIRKRRGSMTVVRRSLPSTRSKGLAFRGTWKRKARGKHRELDGWLRNGAARNCRSRC